MNLITLDGIYVLIGIIVGSVSLRIAFDKNHPSRIGASVFWGIFAITFIFGKWLPSMIVGYLILILAVVAALGKVKKGGQEEPPKEERAKSANRLKGKIFIPALVIPVVTVIGTLTFGRIHIGGIHFIDSEDATLIALGLSTIVAFIVAQRLTKAPSSVPLHEGSRLLQAVGWAVMLPQLLAALGSIFETSGVGETISDIVGNVLPTQFALVAVVAYCVGMALFTVIMGNAFAAFAVITGGIGVPLIVQMHGGNPGIMAALGMFAGFCGTLMTPMAADFNIVPALLLELKNKNAVIKAQFPIAFSLLVVDTLLMYALVYSF